MKTSKNPASVSVPREGSARLCVDSCCRAEAGVLIMDKNHNRYKHGLSRTSICKRWYGMRERCFNPKYKGFHNYGGRGITICNEWINDVKSFHDYVISLPNALKPGYTLDRINNDGNYEPGNMRWATHHQQLTNQRKSVSSAGFTGVYPRKSGFYQSKLMKDSRHIHIGTFQTSTQAAEARDMFIIKNGLWEYPLQVIKSTL